MSTPSSHIPAATTGSYPVRDGCDVRPLIDGMPAFRRICEAIEAATSHVWGTVAFLEHDAPMPDGRGSMLDVLGKAAARGVDVRVIFWRSEEVSAIEHFPGNDRQLDWLDRQGFVFRAVWDALPGIGCVHQKSWLIDAGTADEVAFVGGINLDHASTTSHPGHGPNSVANVHDIYAEIRGPAATDVHHNYVQRWNEASERDQRDGVWPKGSADTLTFPQQLSDAAGATPVQITRTVQPGRYTDGTPAIGGTWHDIAQGDFSIYEQYVTAIDAAQRCIYIEDQVIGSPKIVAHLQMALDRGVQVVCVVPGQCHPGFYAARQADPSTPFFKMFEALGTHDAFTLAALARLDEDGSFDEIYVHAKLLLVDDEWATIGSTNTATQSFRIDTEMNASFWDAAVVTGLRAALFAEHLGIDTADLSDVEAAQAFHLRARENAERFSASEPLHGLAYRIDATTYGFSNPKVWTRPDLQL